MVYGGFGLGRDNLEHFKKLADAQAPKVAVKVVLLFVCLLMVGLRLYCYGEGNGC